MQYVKTFFMNFKIFFMRNWNAYFLCSKQTFYIIRMPISYSRQWTGLFSSIHHYIYIFLWLQRSIGQPKVIFLQISKNHNKKTDNPPPKNYPVRSVLLDHFYLLIPLEGMSTFIRSWTSFQNQIWDVHLYNM